MPTNETTQPQVVKARGFASLTPERRREIASQGGKTAHAKGTAHQFTSEKAREAGLKGGRGRSAKREAAQALRIANALEAAGQQVIPEVALTDADAAADLAGEPRPDNTPALADEPTGP